MLHQFLEVGKTFAAWIVNRIEEYGFIENQDFILLSKIGKQNGSGGHNKKDYHLTLDMAKELAMVERNEKGRQSRRYAPCLALFPKLWWQREDFGVEAPYRLGKGNG